MEQNINNRAICILGMHRSGTSAITRAVNLLGVYLGEEKDIFSAFDYNPEGLWERIDFNGLQDRLLAAMKRTWDTGIPLPDHWQKAPEVKPFRDEIVSIIKTNFSDVPLWAWKDPRSTILIGLWRELLNELGIELSVVFAVRNPLDVARSLQKRDSFSLDKGFGIWFNYNIIALQAIEEVPTVFVSYDKFLIDWEVELRRISEGLGIKWPENEADLKEKMKSFVRPDLRHSFSTGEDLRKAGAPQPVIELYKYLQRLLAGELKGSSVNGETVEKLFYAFSSYARFYKYDMTELWERGQTLSLRERQLTEKDQQLAGKDQQLAGKDQQLAGKDRQIVEINRQIAEKDQQLAGKGRQIAEKDQHILDLLTSLSWTITRPLRKVYEVLGGAQSSEQRKDNKSTIVSNLLRVASTYNFRQALPNIRKYGLRTFLQNARRELTGVRSGYHSTPVVQSALKALDFDIYDGKAGKKRRLEFLDAAESLVSIIIPVHNKWDYTYACLYSILENSNDVSYEVIVADDVSTDETKDIEKYVGGIRVIRNETNLRFLKNCNNAAKQARGKYILFLNNDTNVTKNWLRSLVDLIDNDETIGMVGSKLIFPDGRLQEAGGIVWSDASAMNYGRLDDPDKPEYNYVKESDYVSGACMMIRKNLWEELGGFDERYAPAYYEDTDLAFSVRQKGHKVVFQPKSVVVHFEGISHGIDLSSGLKSYQVRNKDIFFEKWQDVLRRDHFAGENNIFCARDRSGNKKTILFIDYEVPRFDMFAGSRTNYMYLKMLVKLGLNVKFMSADFCRVEPYSSALEAIGIEVLCSDWYRNNWRKWIEDNSSFIAYAFLHKPDTAEMFIDTLREKTDAIVIYQGHDLHYIRLLRKFEIEKDIETQKQAIYYEKLEYELIDRSDIVLTFSEVEKNIIEKTAPGKKVMTVPLFFYDNVADGPIDFSSRRDLMYVGGFAHAPNVDAVKWFCTEVFPLILKKLPDIRFHVVGANPPKKIADLRSSNVKIMGQVSDEELERLYETIKMIVIPLRFGAGVKGKVIEAIHKGLPLVSTSIGIEGIWNVESIISPVDDAYEFADAVVSLYCDNAGLGKLSEAYRLFSKFNFSFEKAGQIFSDVLNTKIDERTSAKLLDVLTDQAGTELNKARLIAFYLPQFHPIPENDEWWGKGFTEWRNVSNAKPQFPGHYQPRLPGELGFYDLRVPEVRKAQTELARKYGIEGFSYYHYWFNGKLLLERPLHEMLESGEPDFPFCLCWANEDWTCAWDGRSGKVLLGQHYNAKDDVEHIRYLLRFFKDRRYIRINGRPLFLVYRASLMPSPLKTAERWRAEARKHGIEDLYLCRVESFPEEHADPKAIGFDASIEFQPDWDRRGDSLPIENQGEHSIYDYTEIVRRMMNKPVPPYKRFPGVCPSWDNSPRRKKDAIIFINSSPEIYEKWLSFAVKKVQGAEPDERIVFINAWNEWAEGNYLEPDQQNGRAYLEATRRALKKLREKGQPKRTLSDRSL